MNRRNPGQLEAPSEPRRRKLPQLLHRRRSRHLLERLAPYTLK